MSSNKPLVAPEMAFTQLMPNQRPKVVLVGATGVGKSSIVARHRGFHFNPREAPTLGACYSLCSVLYENHVFEMQVWDTAGQERFRSMAPMYYRNSVGAIVVYDVTQEETLRSAQRWAEELLRFRPSDISIVVVGNKIDLEHERRVSHAQGAAYAHAINARFVETSALNGDGVHEAFELLASAILERQREQTSSDVLTTSFQIDNTAEKKKKKRKCC